MIEFTQKYYQDTIPFDFGGRALALGFFDGIHMGHIEIIRKAVRYAKSEGLKSTVMTFSSFPKGDGKYLTTVEEKLEILSSMGVDELLILDFNEVKDMTPDEFCEAIVRNLLNSRALFVGEDFTYGAKASGNVETLTAFCKSGDIFLKVLKDKMLPGSDRRVSSTWLREAVSDGDVELYSELCWGRNFKYSGRVVKGKQLGRELGFPTANVLIADDKALVRRGVYASVVHIGKETYYGVSNVGRRPTVEDAVDDVLETYIFDFDSDIYGATIVVELVKFLRPETTFSGKDELVAAVENNKVQAKEYFTQNCGVVFKS